MPHARTVRRISLPPKRSGPMTTFLPPVFRVGLRMNQYLRKATPRFCDNSNPSTRRSLARRFLERPVSPMLIFPDARTGSRGSLTPNKRGLTKSTGWRATRTPVKQDRKTKYDLHREHSESLTAFRRRAFYKHEQPLTP